MVRFSGDGVVQRRRWDGERRRKGFGVLLRQTTRRRREWGDHRGEGSRSRGGGGRRRQGQEPRREVVRYERVGRLVHGRGLLNETGCGRDRVRGPVLVLVLVLGRRRYGQRRRRDCDERNRQRRRLQCDRLPRRFGRRGRWGEADRAGFTVRKLHGRADRVDLDDCGG
jgi:hypothetical protein